MDTKTLSETHPEIADEAYGWDPSEVSYGSGIEREWKCKRDERHIFKATPNRRTRSTKGGCPYCSNRKVLKGVNDLATTHPEIAKQAYGWDPTTVVAGSSKEFLWRCTKDHIWPAKISVRTTFKTGCSVCVNQHVLIGVNDLATTHPEIAKQAYGWDPTATVAGSNKKVFWMCDIGHTWDAAISSRTNAKSPTGCRICKGQQVQSGFNDLATTHPELAQEAYGWDPSRVMAGSDLVVDWKCSRNPDHVWPSRIANRKKGKGCPYCFGRGSAKKIVVGLNDLATTHPELSKQAYGWDPKTVGAGSSKKKYEWVCHLGHVWPATIEKRAGKKPTGCPICNNNILLIGFNDFKTLHPDLAVEADGWDASQVLSGTRELKNWKCQYGHKWRATLNNRTKPLASGCPTCKKAGFDPNLPGYLYFLHHESWQRYSIGITNHPIRRFTAHRSIGWEVKEVKGPLDGLLVQEWETSILRMLKGRGVRLISKSQIQGRNTVGGESWQSDQFEPKSIEEIMLTTQEYEEGQSG